LAKRDSDHEMTRLLEKSPATMTVKSEDAVVVAESTTVEDIRQSVKDYPAYAPASLKDLDPFRYEILPQTLRERREDTSAATSLTKVEVVRLVQWKLFVVPV